ncbi:zinc finger protein 566-like isoform X7 [Ambystoma mexicanum]|uniref:zinc finger protein 566-like isoform X7 n=1 Tax=Ambystoma mexicanum TaxID=8296 RepID=UPI0037E833D4
MLQHRPETVPVGQYDVSAYFSEEQWKPLHEWQKELYKNVMNEIHQALVSLGPLIATTVFSLITHESKDLCPVVHQDCERKNLDDHSRGHEFVSFIIKEEEEVCFLDQWDLKNRQSSNLPRTQEEGLNRQRKEGESVETTPVNNVPLRQTNMTALQTSEKETNPRIQPWSSDYWEMDMEKVADIEMGSSNPTHTNVHHVALKERASGPFNEFQTNLKSVSFHQNPMQTQRAYVCTQCGKSFNLRGELVRHMRTHNKIRPYACTECKKSFLKKGDFTRHWRTHTGEKPYACSDCQKRFNLKGNLEQHRILIHSGVRPYQCTQCNKSFTRQSHLLKHIEIHSLVP